MGKFQQKMYRFMYGRYGADNLYNFCAVLILIALVLNVMVSVFVKNEAVGFVLSTAILLFDVVIIVWSTYRFMSRKIDKRRRENERFLKMKRGVRRIFTFNTSRKSKSGNMDSAQFIFRDCTKCGATLRLPRKAGRNKVKCPRCLHRFTVVSKKVKYNG